MCLCTAPASGSAPSNPGGDRPPHILSPICARKAGTKLSAKGGRVLGGGGGTAPCPLLATTPGSLQGEAQWGESSLVQPCLPIGYKAPQCPPPASPSLAGAATSVVVANAAQSSGHSCASQRPASPTRSQTPQLRAPRPLPTCLFACPARPHSHPGRCTLRLPGPVPPAPSPARPMRP